MAVKNTRFKTEDFIKFEAPGFELEEGSALRSAERVLDNVVTAPERPEVIREVPSVKTQPESGVKPVFGINIFGMMFLLFSIVATITVSILYLQIRSDIVKLNREISGLEKTIASMNAENNALEAELNSKSFDYEEIFSTAVGKLGMVYPNGNEIIKFSDDSTSYYRDYTAAR